MFGWCTTMIVFRLWGETRVQTNIYERKSVNMCIVNRKCPEYVFSQHVVHTKTGNFELGNFQEKFSIFFHYSDENRLFLCIIYAKKSVFHKYPQSVS